MRCLILLDSAWSLRERWKIDLSFGTYLYFASNSVLTRYLTIIKTCVLRNCCYSYPAVILLFCDTAIVALPELSKIFVQWSILNYILNKIWADFYLTLTTYWTVLVFSGHVIPKHLFFRLPPDAPFISLQNVKPNGWNWDLTAQDKMLVST